MYYSLSLYTTLLTLAFAYPCLGSHRFAQEVLDLSPNAYFRLWEEGTAPLAFANEVTSGVVGNGNWEQVTDSYTLGASSSPDPPVKDDAADRYAKLTVAASPKLHLGTVSVTGPMFTYPGFAYGMFVYPNGLPTLGKTGELLTTSVFGINDGSTEYAMHVTMIYIVDSVDQSKASVQCKVTNNDDYAATATKAGIEVGAWFHAMCVLEDSEQLNLYFNGLKVDSNPISGPAPTTGTESNKNSLGQYTETRIAYIPTVTSMLNVYVDEITTFDKELTEIEVYNLYQTSQAANSVASTAAGTTTSAEDNASTASSAVGTTSTADSGTGTTGAVTTDSAESSSTGTTGAVTSSTTEAQAGTTESVDDGARLFFTVVALSGVLLVALL